MKNFFKHTLLLTLVSLSFFGMVETAFAQAYVPVKDIELNPAFAQYVTDLFQRWDQTFGASAPNGTTDSLRDLISGSDPGGLARADCKVGDTEWAAYAQGTDGTKTTPDADWGPWMYAWASSTLASPPGALPNEVPAGARASGNTVKVNTSNSLRCLLKEIVSWQKLGMSIQLHQMLKQYIADAQTAQLNKQLMNQMTAANFNFAKAGNIVNNGGFVSTQATYNINIAQNEFNVNERQLEAATDQAAADPAAGSPQGSWGLCEPWRLETAALNVKNNRKTTADPFFYTQSATQCNLTAPTNTIFTSENDYAKFNDNFNDPASLQGGFASFHAITENPADNPLWAAGLADEVTRGRIERQQDVTDKEADRTGFVPTKQFDTTNAADVHNLSMQYGQDIQPAGTNNTITTGLLDKQYSQTLDSETLDSQASDESQTTPTDVTTNTGLAGANTVPLASSPTAINQLVEEFYNVISYGYYGLDDGCPGNSSGPMACGGPSLNTPDITGWANATMLSIYDQMAFPQNKPSTVYPTDQTTRVDSGY